MEQLNDEAIEAVINDIRSKDITQKFCDLISNCIIKNLTAPITLRDCKQFKINELTEAKRKADEKIKNDLKKELLIDVNDFSNIRSVFETPSFYDDILSALICKNTSVDSDSLKQNDISVPASKSAVSGANTVKNLSNTNSEVKIYEKECSLKDGHVDLDMSAIERGKMNLRLADSFTDCCIDNVDNEFHIKPIVSTPLTQSQFQLININFYLILSQFCLCCQKRLKDLSVLNTLTKDRKLESQIIFNNELSLFRPYVREDDMEECDVDKTDNLTKDSELEKKLQDTELFKKSEEEMPLEVLLKLKTQSEDFESPLAAMHRVYQESSDKENTTDKQSLSPVLDIVNSKVDTTADKESTSASLPPNKQNQKKSVLTSKDILDDIYYKYQEACRNNKTSLNKSLTPTVKKEKRNERVKITYETPALKEKLDNRKNIATSRASDVTGKARLITAPSNDSVVTGKSRLITAPSRDSDVTGKSRLITAPSRDSDVSGKSRLITAPSRDSDVSGKSRLITAPSRDSDVTGKSRLISLDPAKSNVSNKMQVGNGDDDDDDVIFVDDNSLIGLTDDSECLSNATTGTSDKKMKILSDDEKRYLTKKFAKLLRKEKRRKRKLMRKKAKIDLTPPPGVDLDEFLLEQLESIKLQLLQEGDDSANLSETNSNLDVPDIIKDQAEVDGQLHRSAEIGDSVSTVLHSSTDLKQRKVLDCTAIAKDFDSLPEFENKNESKSSPLKQVSNQNWKKPTDPRNVKKSIVLQLRNRSRTPQISRNRLNAIRRNTNRFKSRDAGQSMIRSDSSRVAGNSIINSNESPSVTAVSEDDGKSGSTNHSVAASKSKLQSPLNSDLNSSTSKDNQNVSKSRSPVKYKRYRSKSRSPHSKESITRTYSSDAATTETCYNESRRSSDHSHTSVTPPDRYSYRDRRSRSRSPYSKSSHTRDYRRSPIRSERMRISDLRRKISPRGKRSRSKSPRHHQQSYRRRRSRSNSSPRTGTTSYISPPRGQHQHRSQMNASRHFMHHSKSARWSKSISPDQYDENVLLNVEKAKSPPKESDSAVKTTSTGDQSNTSSVGSNDCRTVSTLPSKYVRHSDYHLPKQYRFKRSNYYNSRSNYYNNRSNHSYNRYNNYRSNETLHSTREQTVERTLSVNSENDLVEEIKTITVEQTFCTIDEDN